MPAAAVTRALSTHLEPSPTTGALLDPGQFEIESEAELWAERASLASPVAQIAGIVAEQYRLAEEQEEMNRVVAQLKDLVAGSKFASC